MAPRSFSANGSYADARAEMQEITDHLPATSDAVRGRKVLLSMLDALEGTAQPGDTVNASYNYTLGATGQIDITAVVSLVPLPTPTTPPPAPTEPPTTEHHSV